MDTTKLEGVDLVGSVTASNKVHAEGSRDAQIRDGNSRPARAPSEIILGPTPRPRRSVCLRTAEHVLHEMQRVYRACRSGELPTQEGSRLMFMLGVIRQTHELVVLERRVAALEESDAEATD